VRLEEAMGVLGVRPGATSGEVRAAFRRLVRDHHPDLDATSDATRRTAELTEAYALVQRQLASSPDGRIESPTPPSPAPPAAHPPAAVPVKDVDGDSILLDVPADEAFAALFEAAGRVGHVAYFDRQLGILETVVRFEGGPSCSVLITLQGRANGTEAFCTMESIEAAPTPPIAPVVDALVEELAAPR
jgi:hypothetical protein